MDGWVHYECVEEGRQDMREAWLRHKGGFEPFLIFLSTVVDCECVGGGSVGPVAWMLVLQTQGGPSKVLRAWSSPIPGRKAPWLQPRSMVPHGSGEPGGGPVKVHAGFGCPNPR